MATACFTPLYTNNGNQVFGNEQALLLTIPKPNAWFLADSGRPFIPFCGMTLNANGIYVPDTLANNIAQISTFAAFFSACRTASINTTQGTAGFVTKMQTGNTQYLYDKTFSVVPNLNRYLQNAGIVFNFWTNANPAWTVTEYYEALQGLKNNIQAVASKDLYIPNGTYLFEAGTLVTALDAWLAANANFKGLLGIEMYQ